MRQAAVARRLDELVLQLEQLQQRITDKIGASDDTGDDNERRRRLETQQMTAKLNFVVEQSALERQRVDEDVKWTRLLEELPMEERGYLGRAADEKFVEQMKYLRGERETQVCEEIDRAIKEYYDSQPAELRPSPEHLNVSTDDLCALLSFILISAPSSCLHVFTQLALLGSFAPQSVANGREGFALATCTAAVHHLMQLR
ncbi:hypothetical protein JG687_00017201 [Phytophthora cactorum]|uniref:VPS9 domain-containing protein n=1 Tax=Phytophthora cactorum TaxID=29920 RepID=A0A8T1TQW8_9STRA|nr:hypothetical protein JG687_00017201 [Phytophthora cactorum]